MPRVVNLLDQLQSFWELDEVSGSRFDSMGKNTLSDINTVTQGAGKVYKAAQFTAANSERLSVANTPTLQPGPDFSIQVWFNYTTLGSTGIFFAKDGVASQRAYVADLPGTDVFRLFVFDSVSGSASAATATLTNNTWFHTICTFDSSDKKGRIYLNNGAAAVSAALTNGIKTDATSPFELGDRVGGTVPYGGLMDQVGFWKRLLTADERTILFNSGNGLSFASMVAMSRIMRK